MAAISQIEVLISTGDNGTNAPVFAAIAGREFCLNRPGVNDFRANATDRFVLGGTNNVFNVAHPAENDPARLLPLDTADIDRFPAYVRYEGGPQWHVKVITVNVTA